MLVANSGEGLGLMLTGDTNMVADIHPEGAGAKGGMMVGDIILAVDDRVVTSVDWRPSDDEGLVVCRAPFALEPAGLALDPTKPAVSLKVLRPVEARQAEERAPPSLAEEMAAARASVPQEPPSPQRRPAQQAHVAEQRPPTAQERERMTAQVHAMYPWATQIATADGGMKNKYNLAQGTSLQPLQQLQPLDPDATMRKTAAFAAPLGRS